MRLSPLPLVLGLSFAAHTQSESDPIYRADRLLEVRIRLDPANWQKLRVQHGLINGDMAQKPYDYFEATVWIDGRKFERVGVRKKGLLGSVVSTKPSLKIRFDKYEKEQLFHGLDQLTLNNNIQDGTHIQQVLAYSLFRKAGVAAPRTGFATVTVNGEKLGVYTNVESIRKTFIKRVFGEAKGKLFEGYVGDFDWENHMGKIVNKWSDKPGAGKKHLERIMAAIEKTPVDSKRVAELVDLDAFMTFWASEVLMGHWDSYSGNRNNYYIYRHGETKRFHFIPWGTDSVFQDPGPVLRRYGAVVPKAVKATGVLCRRLWTDQDIRTRYKREMRRLLKDVWDEKELLAEVERVRTLLGDHIDVATFDAKVTAVREFISSRRGQVEPELEGAGPDWPDLRKMKIGGAGKSTVLTMRGSFDTKIGARPGTGTFTMGKGMEALPAFDRVVAIALPEMPEFVRPSYPFVNITGTGPGKRVRNLSLVFDPIHTPLKQPDVPVDHFCVWAMLVEGRPQDPKAKRHVFRVTGVVKLETFGAKKGDAIKGSFELSVPVRN